MEEIGRARGAFSDERFLLSVVITSFFRFCVFLPVLLSVSFSSESSSIILLFSSGAFLSLVLLSFIVVV